MIKKLLIFPVIVVAATLIASIFGIIHDQITYSISPEYYTKFKFNQFGLVLSNRNDTRLVVAITGIIATWWVGLIIGISFGLTSLITKNWKAMLRLSFRAMGFTFGSTCLAAFIGYVYGKFINDKSVLRNTYNVQDFDSFITVGSVHTASYIGGFIGIIAGCAYILMNRKKLTPAPAPHQ